MTAGKIVPNFIGYWAKGRAQPGALQLSASSISKVACPILSTVPSTNVWCDQNVLFRSSETQTDSVLSSYLQLIVSLLRVIASLRYVPIELQLAY
jgi:hypothetical protein